MSAITRRDPDAPKPTARKRRGETAGDLRKQAARPVMRNGRAAAPAARGRYAALHPAKAIAAPAAYAGAMLYLADTLDCMNPYWPPDAGFYCNETIDDNLSAGQDHYFPQP